MSDLRFYIDPEPFYPEQGGTLPLLRVAYQTWGKLNAERNNVIWVCHAFTASSDVLNWWPGLAGSGKILDSDKYFIVCANILGSCYGSTGPLDVNPDSGMTWFRDFPALTIRDIVRSLELLRKHLGIRSINMLIGGSIGAFQCLEWAIMVPDIVRNLVFISANACSTPWNIALNETQRMAITSDPTFFEDKPNGGLNGLKAARAIALLSYRNNHTYNHGQKEDNFNKISDFKVISYQHYQSEKFVKRFNAYSYMIITYMFDSHNIGRGRGSVSQVLQSVAARTLVISMRSDQLFPFEEQELVAQLIPGAKYTEISTTYGHDGFLIEVESIAKCIREFLSENQKFRISPL
jgi:homoserine O-acetyltransferase